MKRRLVFMALTLLIAPALPAKESPSETGVPVRADGWVAVQWRANETPIVMPLIFPTQAACEALNTQIHAIAQETVHIERQRFCQRVFPARAT
jgi:hypothetical protein